MRRVCCGISVILMLQGFAAPVGAQPPASPRAERSLDADGNKIFDDLDDTIRGAAAARRFDVIALFASGSSASQKKAAEAVVGPFSTAYEYRTLPAVAASLTAGQIRALASRPETVQVEADDHMEFAMASARAAFGSDRAQADFSVDGNNETGACPGVKSYCPDDTVVAVVDTGIDASHMDLDGGKVLAARECSDPPCVALGNYSGSHGTHVASIIAGEGDANPANHGVAPGAALVSVKVGTQWGANEAGVDAGIEWVLANHSTYGIDLVNLSVTGSGPSDGADVTARLTNQLAAAGLTPIVAAGNTGPAAGTISTPGTAKFATTVGAMNDFTGVDPEVPVGFDLATFSSRGPTADGRIKPDIAAPGVDITAADAAAPENSYSHTGYASHSGTSMSSPFVAGVATLMLDANPALRSSGSACASGDPSDDCLDGVYDSTMALPLRAALTGSAVDWGPPGVDIEYGYGRLDAYAAVDAASSIAGAGGPPVPTHSYVEGALSGPGVTATHTIAVTGTDFPISVTFVMPTWTSATTPNFDVALLDPTGAQVATSPLWTDRRQETVGYKPTLTGDYTLRVTSIAGAGPYWFDASFSGGPPPSPSPSPTQTPPDVPSGVSAAAVSLNQINLAWVDCATETGYKVERAMDATGPWTNVATPGANTTSYSDKNLQAGTTYYYRVSSFNGAGSSAPSPVVSAKTLSDTKAPSTPTGLKAVGGKAKISLTWAASTDTGGSGLAGYKVFRSTSSTGTYTQVGSTTTTAYTDAAVTARTTYYYYVIAYDGAGNNSAKSATVSAKSS